MTDQEKDKVIIEWLGECWHEWESDLVEGESGQYSYSCSCKKCGIGKFSSKGVSLDLSTWSGFGWLLERLRKREEYMDFVVFSGGHVDVDFDRYVFDGILHPPLFRDAVYDFITRGANAQ